jgi:hypothetical protein
MPKIFPIQVAMLCGALIHHKFNKKINIKCEGISHTLWCTNECIDALRAMFLVRLGAPHILGDNIDG